MKVLEVECMELADGEVWLVKSGKAQVSCEEGFRCP